MNEGDEVAQHTEVRRIQILIHVDVAAIGLKGICLTGGDLPDSLTLSRTSESRQQHPKAIGCFEQKSAEVIVVESNEPFLKTEDSQISEGLNVVVVLQ